MLLLINHNSKLQQLNNNNNNNKKNSQNSWKPNTKSRSITKIQYNINETKHINIKITLIFLYTKKIEIHLPTNSIKAAKLFHYNDQPTKKLQSFSFFNFTNYKNTHTHKQKKQPHLIKHTYKQNPRNKSKIKEK